MKKNLHCSLKKLCATKIQEALNDLWPSSALSLEDIYHSLTTAPQDDMGHISFPTFPLARALKMGPPQIAQKLSEKIQESNDFQELRPAGPYLNFFLKKEDLGVVLSSINTGKYFETELALLAPKTMVEFSQPNTHKILHVGHMRNMCLGNSIVQLLKYSNTSVIPVNYLGDMGTHVAKTLWYMLKNPESKPVEGQEKGEWLGELYTLAHNQLEDELGSDKEEQNRKELTSILKNLEDQNSEESKLWLETRSWSLELMNHVYTWANIRFENWFYESQLDAPSIELALELYEKGILEKSEGAIGIDFKKEKLGYLLMVKKDGTGLYATKDIELAKQKFEKFQINQSIYVVDNRQSLHFKQVFRLLEEMGFEEAKNCIHIPYEMVELPDGAMSSRKGNIIPLMDLVDKMQKTIIEKYLERYRGEWTDEEILETAKMVANGAIKYGMLRIDNNRKIVFDMDKWLQLDGETGPYLQYVHARIVSLLEKNQYNADEKINWETLTNKEETSLLVKLTQFNNVVEIAAEKFQTIHVCKYLYELGKLFNSFYAACPVKTEEDAETKKARLALSQAVKMVISKGLELLGIPAPLKM
jgi:arginyl-tRNA synthetase